MRFLIFSLIGLLRIQNIFATFLECDFNYKQSHWSTEYACVATDLQTSLGDRNVTKVNGHHVSGKSNDDVTKLFVQKQYCPYLPLNVGNYFKNLQTLYITKSNVQYLLNGDLDGLTKLKVFDVSYNSIEHLGREFFANHRTIEIISFYDCQLKIIDPKSLDSLTNLREAHFQYNVCVNYAATKKSLLDDLKAKIGDKCANYRYEDNILQKVNEFSSYVNSHNYSNQSSFESSSSVNVHIITLCLSVVITIVLIAVFLKLFLRTLRNNWSETSL